MVIKNFFTINVTEFYRLFFTTNLFYILCHRNGGKCGLKMVIGKTRNVKLDVDKKNNSMMKQKAHREKKASKF